MKKLLVPTDFSSCAERASETAIELAKATNAKIYFLHLLSIPAGWVYGSTNQMYPDVTEKLAQVTEQLKKLLKLAENQKVEAMYHVSMNDDKKSINQYVEEHGIDMIIMGSHGASGMKELFVGSNAQKVIRFSEIPVLIVKENNKSVLVPEIVFVSDFEAEAMKPFEKVLHIAHLLQAKVHLLYVNTPAFFNDTTSINERMESFEALTSNMLSKSSVHCDYVFEDGIQQYCDKHNIGLVAIATHGRRGFSRILIGNDAEKVVNHLSTPVLSLHF
ncbi:MAG: universal stress protein [Cyclobacteriaceae bacterium]